MKPTNLKITTLISCLLLTSCLFACSSNEKTLRNIEATAEAKSLNWTPESTRLIVSDKGDSTNKETKNIPAVPQQETSFVSSGISINDLEAIGYKKNEKISETDPSRYRYDDILEAWDGEIVVNNKSHFLATLIFDKKFDDVEGEVMMISLRGRLRRAGTTQSITTGYVKNILVACYAQEACSHIIETFK